MLLNAVIEKAATQQGNPLAIRARSGLVNFKAVGTGRARALFAKAGLFGNAGIVLADSTAYLLGENHSLTALTGAIPGTGLVDIDAGQDADLNSIARVATGTGLYQITETAVALESFPTLGGAGASSICFHRQFWFATEAGTDQAYYLAPGDIAWTAFSFVSAEYSPDPLKGIRSRGDQFMLLGSTTCEAWALTGSASPPISPFGGLNFDFGCLTIRSAVNCAGSLIWVDNNGVVRKWDGGDVSAISDDGLAEQIMAVDPADISASYHQEGLHRFYKLRLGGVATWVYDLSLPNWSKRNTAGADYWRAQLFTTLGSTTVAADVFTNQIYSIDADAHDDAGTDFPVEFMGFLEIPEGSIDCVNLELICAVGEAPLGVTPVIQERHSDDQGKSWSRWRERPLGNTGQYTQRVLWTKLGTAKAPFGRIFHFRASSGVGRRFSDLRMNVP